MTVVGPFTAGVVAAVILLTWYTWTDEFCAVMGFAWGQAAGVMVGLKIWGAIVRHRHRVELTARAWPLAAAAGAANLFAFLGAVRLTAARAYRHAIDDDLALGAAVAAEAVIHFAWAVVLTRRCRSDDG